MIYDKAFFDRGIDRRGTDCFKWDNTDANAPGAVPLWVADMDFPCPDEIVDGMARRLRHPCYGYTFDGEEGFWLSGITGRRGTPWISGRKTP